MHISRIPAFESNTAEGMQAWFAAMAERGLLFHPEDAPKNIIFIETGKPTFTAEECRELDGIMQQMFSVHGNAAIDACYPVFMHAAGLDIGLAPPETQTNG